MLLPGQSGLLWERPSKGQYADWPLASSPTLHPCRVWPLGGISLALPGFFRQAHLVLDLATPCHCSAGVARRRVARPRSEWVQTLREERDMQPRLGLLSVMRCSHARFNYSECGLLLQSIGFTLLVVIAGVCQSKHAEKWNCPNVTSSRRRASWSRAIGQSVQFRTAEASWTRVETFSRYKKAVQLPKFSLLFLKMNWTIEEPHTLLSLINGFFLV